MLYEVITECLAVAKAAGVQVPGDMHEAARGIARSMATQSSSTAQDLARGKKTEIDHLNGVVVRKGEALGVPTPVNRTLTARITSYNVCYTKLLRFDKTLDLIGRKIL